MAIAGELLCCPLIWHLIIVIIIFSRHAFISGGTSSNNCITRSSVPAANRMADPNIAVADHKVPISCHEDKQGLWISLCAEVATLEIGVYKSEAGQFVHWFSHKDVESSLPSRMSNVTRLAIGEFVSNHHYEQLIHAYADQLKELHVSSYHVEDVTIRRRYKFRKLKKLSYLSQKVRNDCYEYSFDASLGSPFFPKLFSFGDCCHRISQNVQTAQYNQIKTAFQTQLLYSIRTSGSLCHHLTDK
jgi:hypothetical protein